METRKTRKDTLQRRKVIARESIGHDQGHVPGREAESTNANTEVVVVASGVAVVVASDVAEVEANISVEAVVEVAAGGRVIAGVVVTAKISPRNEAGLIKIRTKTKTRTEIRTKTRIKIRKKIRIRNPKIKIKTNHQRVKTRNQRTKKTRVRGS